MCGIQRIVWILLIVAVINAQEELYFAKDPQDVEVVSGKSVTLPCEVTPNEGITYYWELNGSKIANTTRRYQQGSNLHITRADRERDSGQFRCIAQDLKGLSITSSLASLNIQLPSTTSKASHLHREEQEEKADDIEVKDPIQVRSKPSVGTPCFLIFQ